MPAAEAPPPKPRARRGAAARVGAAPTAGPSTRERVFAYVRQRLLEGNPPTVREIRDALGLRAVQSVQVHLQALTTEGRLQQAPANQRGRSRGYQLTSPPVATRLVPILGRVQAGAPTLAVEEAEGVLAIVARGDAEELFALRVRGESMIGAGILPGDLVIVRRDAEVRDGDLVVALVDDEATVKVLRRRGDMAELVPANPAFAVLQVPGEALVVLGRVIEVRRQLAGDRGGGLR